MKNLLFLVFLIPNLTFCQGLGLPPVPLTGYVFPMGSKFSIRLLPIDSVNVHFSVIHFEPFDKVVDTWENDSLFENGAFENTITFYFCFGTHGDTEVEREANMQVLLLMKNYSKYSLSYISEIQRIKEKKKFEPTSNVGILAGAKGIEMWPYMICNIQLRDFKLMNLEIDENND